MKRLEPVDVDQLINRYTSVVKAMAKRIIANSNVVDIQDLEQAGMMALISVAHNYDASTGHSLGTYARTCIRNALIAEANKCCDVFTIDPKIRLQVNQILNLRKQDMNNEQIMSHLGLSRNRFYTLNTLADMHAIDVDDIIDETVYYDASSVIRALQEIGLSGEEIYLVELLITSHSFKEIQENTGLNKRSYRDVRESIEQKVRDWGVKE